MANHKVNLALIPLNGTNYWRANDSSGGLSRATAGEGTGGLAGRRARAPARRGGTRTT